MSTEPVSGSAVALAEQLIAQRMSYREIRRRTGLGSSSITRILRGELSSEQLMEPQLVTLVAERCPGCGGLQVMPCLVCRDRQSALHDAA